MFDDIRPFTDAEIPAAMQRMADHPLFPKVCGWLFPDRPAEQVAAAVRGCRTAEEFQLRFMLPVVEAIASKRGQHYWLHVALRLPGDNKPSVFAMKQY